ncbi:2-keto-4-pentenoate hydratase [Pelagibius sp. Alg239-R121]|uniref:2-keto-4-pentenoate hydratase n=1 Tax=Pelagibius sp. Alg239-R121 TaxID=2993448 RepID=UPI0024A696B6|nr:hypothetical protein [Pelagibius sp. Alg239-R121]
MNISQERVAPLSGLAAKLAAAWDLAEAIDRVQVAEQPQDRTEAYFVQNRMAEELGHGITGWKVGATSIKMRELDGHDDVIPGRILDPTTFVGNSHSLPISRFPNARAETEFAFRLSADLPLRGKPWSAEEIAPLATLHPAIEIIGHRYPTGERAPKVGTLLTIADNGGGIGFVFGNPVTEWQAIDFQNHVISLKVDDSAEAENFLGDMRCIPIDALAALINHLASRGIGLKAGDFVSTGAATVPQPVKAGSHVVADFGSIGKIELQFA